MELNEGKITYHHVTADRVDLGAVHKVRHAIFGQFLPLPPVTLCHTSRDPPKVRHISDPPPIFLVGLVQKIRTKAPCTNSLSIVCGVFVWEGLSEGLWFGRFCPGWFLPIPPSVAIGLHLLKQKVKRHCKFHV